MSSATGEESLESLASPSGGSDWERQVNAMWDAAQERHGGQLQLRPKRDALWLWLPLHWCLRLLTLGRSIDLLDGNYYCLFGRTLWLPGDGQSHHQRAAHLQLSILSHEIDHLDWLYFRDRDARHKPAASLQETTAWFRFWHYIKYWLWPLPFWFARYREQIELWGHERNLEHHLLLNDGKCARWYRKWLVMQFSSATYGWICTEARAFQVIDAMIERVEARFQAIDTSAEDSQPSDQSALAMEGSDTSAAISEGGTGADPEAAKVTAGEVGEVR